MHDDLDSLQQQLANAEGNLQLIQERKSEYVQAEDIPLSMIKNERRLQQQIADLRAKLAQAPEQPAVHASPRQVDANHAGQMYRNRWDLSPKQAGAALVSLATIVACIAAVLVVPEVRHMLGLEVNSSQSFAYAVTVEDKINRQGVFNAEITLLVPDKAPLNAVTDDNGFARLFVESDYVGEPGELRVTADGFQQRIYSIDLTEGNLPRTVQLEPLGVTPTPTPTLTPTSTPTPTPQPMSGQINIAIADFQHDESDKADALREDLRISLRQLRILDEVEIRRVGEINSEEEAKSLADRIYAHGVIWGEVEDDAIKPEFYIRDFEEDWDIVWDFSLEGVNNEEELRVRVDMLIVFIRGLLFLSTGDYPEAAETFQAAVDTYAAVMPNDVAATLTLYAGRSLAAIPSYDGDNAAPADDTVQREQNRVAALEHYSRTITLNPYNSWAYIGIGNVYFYQGVDGKNPEQLLQAQAAYSEALRIEMSVTKICDHHPFRTPMRIVAAATPT
jgi:tetratricopeptide (TPR) repeat protein